MDAHATITYPMNHFATDALKVVDLTAPACRMHRLAVASFGTRSSLTISTKTAGTMPHSTSRWRNERHLEL